MQGVALISHRPQAGENLRARPPGRAFGVVGTVVGNYINVKQLGRIMLGQQLAYRPADDRLFIPRRQQDGKPGFGLSPGDLPPGEQEKQADDGGIDRNDFLELAQGLHPLFHGNLLWLHRTFSIFFFVPGIE